MKFITLILLALLATSQVLASQSAEPVVVRVSGYDAATRMYNFSCVIPNGTDTVRYWTVRPDTPSIEYDISTTSATLTYNLSKDVLYHVGCQVVNTTSGKPVRGDYHIDLRKGPNVGMPDVTVTKANGLNVSLHCEPPAGVKNYSLYWTLANVKEGISLTQFNNKQDINTIIPYALLWDIDCGIWDIDNQTWSQWGYPVEFMTSGEVYLPNVNGCIPGDFCPWNSTNKTNSTNATIPNATTISTNTTSNATTCFSSLQHIPATCTGGSITVDNYNGCRAITCTNASSSLQVLACDKTGGFEMYKQSQVGSAVTKICIGTTCISDGGYAKSSNYPICLHMTNNSQNSTNTSTNTSQNMTTPTNSSQNTTNITTCFNSVQNIPATCTGTITNDTWNGCRTITCTNASSTMKVQACDKTGVFEMYKQSGNGVKICIGTTCISDNGYAKSSSFPICVGTPANISNATATPPTNTTNVTANSTALAAAVSIAPWFPQGKSFVFYCNATGFVPTFYDFSFGNTETNGWRTTNDVYYTYPAAGSYNVTCTARNATVSKNSTMQVTVA